MSELLLFGGTTEGRELAEHCASLGLPADVCVTTDYGASLLPEGVTVHTGKRDAGEMEALLRALRPRLVIDATHPYARQASRNIRAACAACGTECLRVVRDSVPPEGELFGDLPALTARLNRGGEVILCTLGSNALPALTAVTGFRERLWLRLLPSEQVAADCRALGIPEAHILWGKGPFSKAQNIAHLRQSGAALLVTKESGKAGGYPEKAAAATECGVGLLTLLRPPEEGMTCPQIRALLQRRFT